MVEFLWGMGVGIVAAVAACWWFWKSSDAERQTLKDRIKRLEAEVTEKVRGL